jgi:hypothetical protein
MQLKKQLFYGKLRLNYCFIIIIGSFPLYSSLNLTSHLKTNIIQLFYLFCSNILMNKSGISYCGINMSRCLLIKEVNGRECHQYQISEEFSYLTNYTHLLVDLFKLDYFYNIIIIKRVVRLTILKECIYDYYVFK